MRHNNASRAKLLFARDILVVIAAVVVSAGAVMASAADGAPDGVRTAPPAAPAQALSMKNSPAQPVGEAGGAAAADPGDPDAAKPDAADGARSFSRGFVVGGAPAGAQKANGVVHPRSKLRTARAQTVDTGFWFYDATTELYYDDDQDGFYYGLDVYFDADTDYFDVDVYALLYLSRDGGPWELYYETNVFRLQGATGDDEYVVETDLFEAYPTGYYDVLIDLYDADFGDLVATIGPDEAPDLALLPLEDQQRDAPVVVETVVVHGGGGALGWPLLLLAALAATRRARRRVLP